LLLKKAEKDLESEISILKKKADRLEKELERLEKIEQSLAEHEIIQAKKVADMNRIEENMQGLVPREEFEGVKKELKRLEEHEALLAESSKFMREVVSEVGKIKESHKLTRGQVMARDQVSKSECEERFNAIKQALEEVEHVRNLHKRKADRDEVAILKKELHNRLGEIEYQNKLIMKYLKRVDEALQKKLNL
jgi:hypothetical protein